MVTELTAQPGPPPGSGPGPEPLLRTSGLPIIPADDLGDAAYKAVAAAKKAA